MKKFLTIGISFLFAVTLIGCNTISGAGKDVKAGGEAIEKVANKTKHAITKKSDSTSNKQCKIQGNTKNNCK